MTIHRRKNGEIKTLGERYIDIYIDIEITILAYNHLPCNICPTITSGKFHHEVTVNEQIQRRGYSRMFHSICLVHEARKATSLRLARRIGASLAGRVEFSVGWPSNTLWMQPETRKRRGTMEDQERTMLSFRFSLTS